MHLKCGVSVSKRKDSECAWVEEAEFKDVSDKTFGDFFIAPHQIKRELDCNTSNGTETPGLPILYPETTKLNSFDRNEDTSHVQRSQTKEDCNTRDQSSRLSIIENKNENEIESSSETKNLSEEDGDKSIPIVDPNNIEDQSDAVVVRPIPAELPVEIHKKRRPSLDGNNDND